MKRFVFPMEQVLKLKQQRKRLAELRQQQAHAALKAAQASHVLLLEQIESAARASEAAVRHSAGLGAWEARYRHVCELQIQLEELQRQCEEAEKHLEVVNLLRVQISTEVETLELLRRQQWDAHQKAAEHARLEQLSERSVQRWRAGRESRV